MTTMPKGINWNEQFYKLLRLSLRLVQEFIHIQMLPTEAHNRVN